MIIRNLMPLSGRGCHTRLELGRVFTQICGGQQILQKISWRILSISLELGGQSWWILDKSWWMMDEISNL